MPARPIILLALFLSGYPRAVNAVEECLKRLLFNQFLDILQARKDEIRHRFKKKNSVRNKLESNQDRF